MDDCQCFDALGGLPGAYVKWFLGAVGAGGLHTLLAGFADKRAAAVCTFAFCAGRGAPVALLQGRTRGTIVAPRAAAGRDAFGWDPVFLPDGAERTYAEMEPAEKNACSHRGKALAKVRAHLDAVAAQDAGRRAAD